MDTSSLSDFIQGTFGLTAANAGRLVILISTISGTVAWAVSKWFEGSLSKRNAAEIERLKSKLDSATHVRRAQFEVEFKAYQEIWPRAYWLKEAALILRPMMENVDAAKTEEERRSEKYNRFKESYNAALFEIENNAPFYPQHIYSLLSEFRNCARIEDIAFEY